MHAVPINLRVLYHIAELESQEGQQMVRHVLLLSYSVFDLHDCRLELHVHVHYHCLQMNDQTDGGYLQADGDNSWENHQGVPPGLQNSTYPPQPYMGDDARLQFQDYPSNPSPQGQGQPHGVYDDEVGPQITADIDR